MKRFMSVSLMVIGILATAAAASAQTAARGPQPTPACGPNLAIKNTDKQSRCFELRTYTVREGSSIDLLHSRFRDHTTALFKKHGMTIIGYWQPVAKPDTLIYLLAYKDARRSRCVVGRVQRRSGMGENPYRDAGERAGGEHLHGGHRLFADEVDQDNRRAIMSG